MDKDILDFLEELDIEKFNKDQKYRNKIYKELTDLFNKDSKNLDVFFEAGIDEKNPLNKKVKALTTGLTPVEMAGLLVANMPQALKDKAENNITHTWQYFGKAGKGKTTSISYALGAMNGLVFAVGKRLQDGVKEEEIVKDIKNFLGTLKNTLEGADINIDPDKFAKDMIEGTKAFMQKISESKEAKSLWNEALDLINKNPEWDVLSNTVAPMTKLAKIDAETGKIDLSSILPAKPFAIWDDLYQNMIDERSISTFMQKLAEKGIPLSQFVITSNHSEQAYDFLEKTFGANEGFKARAGLFINAADSGITDTLLDKKASSAFATDINLLNLLNDVKKWMTGAQKSRLINAILAEKNGKQLLVNLAETLKEINDKLGVDFIDVLNKNAEKLTADEYRLTPDGGNNPIHNGESLLLYLAKGALGDELFEKFKNSLDQIWSKDLPLAFILNKSGIAVTDSADKLKSVGEAFLNGDITSALNELKKVKKDSGETDKKAKEALDKVVENIEDAAKKIGDKWQGRFIPDADIPEIAKRLKGQAVSGEVDLREFQALNHRGICSLNLNTGDLKIEDIKSLRHIKQLISTLTNLKDKLDPQTFKATAAKLVLGTLGVNEVSKQILKSVGVTGEGAKFVTPKELIDIVDKKVEEWDGKDPETFAEIFKEIHKALRNKGFEEGGISDVNAFMEFYYKEKIKDGVKDYINGNDKWLDKAAEKFDKLLKMVEFAKKANQDEDLKMNILEKMDPDKGELDDIDRFMDKLEAFDKVFKDGEIDGVISEPMQKELKTELSNLKDDICKNNKTDDFIKGVSDSLFNSKDDNEIMKKLAASSFLGVFR